MKERLTKRVQGFSILIILALTFSALGVSPARASGIRYAKPIATGKGDCSSWANACTLQTALTGASSGDEIWAAAGTYKPTTNVTDRAATFQLTSGTAIYGGFTGTETTRDQRNPATNLTIMSGDIDNNDSQNPIINLSTVTGNTTNSYHVVRGATGATLDGFTVTAGYADTYPDNRGGGMINNSSSPLVKNTVFSGNLAARDGGGMSNWVNSDPTLANVTFIGNSATGQGGHGGGMFNNLSSPTMMDVTFSYNSAYFGGGMFSYHTNSILTNVTFSSNSARAGGGMDNESGSYPVLINVTFSGNSATSGAGMLNEGSSPAMTNVTFNNNLATELGGGLNNSASDPTLVNVTFSGNSAQQGGGMFTYNGSNPQISNTIFWENTAATLGAQIANNGYSLSISDSIVQGGCPTGSTCTNLITTDPMLGTLGDYGGFTQTIPLLAGSSAIDNGNNTTCAATDQRGVTRPVGSHCDIGAYEYDPVPQVVVSNSSPTDGELVVTEINSLKVIFNKDVLNNGSANAANNPVNYLLVEAGANGNFDTLTCKSGLLMDDTQIAVNSISYDASTYMATLIINGGTALRDGNYRLFICGTTSITDPFGLKLNYGLSDTPISFNIDIGAGSGEDKSGHSKAKSLPVTGFAPDQVSALPIQPMANIYSVYGDLALEIPTIGIKTSIVGVPEVQGNWDVTWLGNNAGWLNGTAFPTWQGNSVITGHVWDANNRPGVFANLKKLKYGDSIKVYAWGKVYAYEVRENLLISPSDTNAALKHEDQAWVTLLTCEDFNGLFAKYSYRRMIRAVLLSISTE